MTQPDGSISVDEIKVRIKKGALREAEYLRASESNPILCQVHDEVEETVYHHFCSV